MASNANKTPSSSSLGSGSSHSSRSSLSPSRSGENVDWKERCHTLENTLYKFKQQASKIRDLLAEKMKELESKTEVAEKKAADMEQRNKELEEKMASASWKPTQADKTLQQLKVDCKQKDKTIGELRDQLDDQKQLRVQQARAVEEKSSRIKDWVTKKVKVLEQENRQMKDDNILLKHQVEVLRSRLQALPTAAAREIHRVSVQESDESRSSSFSAPPPVPEKPSSSVLASIRLQRELASLTEGDVSRMQTDSTPEISPDSEENLVFRDECQDYQEIDDHRQSKYGPRRAAITRHASLSQGPPKVKIERRVFAKPDCSMRSSANSEDFLDKNTSPPLFKTLPRNLHLNAVSSPEASPKKVAAKPKHHPLVSRTPSESPKRTPVPHSSPQYSPLYSPLRVPYKAASASSSPVHRHHSDSQYHDYYEPPPCHLEDAESRAESPAEPYYATVAKYVRSSGSVDEAAYASPPPSPNASSDAPFSNRNIPAFATMPRRKRDPPGKFYPAHSQAPLHGGDVGYVATLGRSHSERRAQPPTPPSRRLPSWENRIYAIANVGLHLTEDGNLANRRSNVPVTEGLYTDTAYEQLTVPVYTTLKGKAAQIRSTPFSGNSSSDSSDTEDQTSLVAMTTAHESEAVMSVAGPSSGQQSVSSVKVRKQVNQSRSGAIKRATSSHSLVSESSSDYALPPDEVSIQNDSGDSEPEHKLLKYTSHQYYQTDHLEKSGYLTKLGGKVKNWRRRWFVLKGGELLYYKSPNDVSRKPQGCITLDGLTKLTKTDGEHTFELSTMKKSYYLTAETTEDMERWIKVLQNVLRKRAADMMMGPSRSKEVVRGWIIKTRNGRNKRCWCVLVGKTLLYYKGTDDKTPQGQISLQNARVEEVDRSCDSDTDSDDTALPDYTLVLWPERQPPTYLMIATRHEKESWLYHLSIASGCGAGTVGTEYEQLVGKLMSADGEPSCCHWSNPHLLHSKEPLSGPLTTLPSENLQGRAIDLFKSCHMFTNVAIESSQLDYHVSLAQSILAVCQHTGELQNELYCQLIKQTSPHPVQSKSGVQNFLCGSHSWFLCDASSPTSPTNSTVDSLDSKMNPSGHVFVQGWQLLSMAIPLFLPKESVLWYLKAHLNRHADPKTDVGKYAVFCQRALERATRNGTREARPSRMEVLSILLRHPYHHSQPISIPVHFLNATYQVVSFDGCTTVDELIQSLNKLIGVRHYKVSGFALFTDDPADLELEHCLRPQLKICDVISQWEQAYLQGAQGRSRKVDVSRTVKLTYKNRVHFSRHAKRETEKEKLLLTYQMNEEVVHGRFPLNRDLAVELCALMAQVEYGDFKGPGDVLLPSSPGRGRQTPPHSLQQVPQLIERFYPRRYTDLSPTQMRCLEQKLADKWIALRGKSAQDCVRVYLTVTRKWPLFASKLFSAKVRHGDVAHDQVWLAVNEDTVALLHYASLRALKTFAYKSIVTFGGCRDDLMLVVKQRVENEYTQLFESKTDKLLFIMSKPKILEITVLMASYINAHGEVKRRTAEANTSQASIPASVASHSESNSPCASPQHKTRPGRVYVSNSIHV